MGFEFPVDVDYFAHPKTKYLIGLIGKTADVYPLRLFAWCAKYAKAGYVKGGCAQIEGAVDWFGKAGVLHKALMESGFLDSDGCTVHDFMAYTGRQILLYENKKRKQRDSYAKKHAPEECSKSADDLPLSSDILPEENGDLPAIREENRREEKNNTPLSPPKGGQNGISRRRRNPPTEAEQLAQDQADAKKIIDAIEGQQEKPK